MDTSPTGGGGAMGTHYRTENLSRETFHDGGGVKCGKRAGWPQPGDRPRQKVRSWIRRWGIEEPDRQPAARDWIRRWSIAGVSPSSTFKLIRCCVNIDVNVVTR